MTENERSEADLGFLSERLGGVQRSIGGDEAGQETAVADKERPHLISPPERERDAARLAGAVGDAFTQYLLNAEKRILNQTDKVRASMLDDIERQRANVESLIGLFAERLRQQEDGLSAVQRDSIEADERLDRQAEAIRSISQTQAQQMALVKQILELLKRSGASTESQTGPIGPEARG